MTKIIKNIATLTLLFVVVLTGFVFFGCEQQSTNPLSVEASGLTTSVGGSLGGMIGDNVTLTFDHPSDDTQDKSFSSYDDMIEAGVFITWTGSSQNAKDNASNNPLKVSFTYRGYTVTCTYTIS